MSSRLSTSSSLTCSSLTCAKSFAAWREILSRGSQERHHFSSRRTEETKGRPFSCRQPSPEGHEKSALATERSHPTELRDQPFEGPVIGGLDKEVELFTRKQGTRERTEVFDAVFAKPALHLAQRVTMLLDVLVLIAKPCRPSRGLVPSISKDGVPRNLPEACPAAECPAEA
jgi:hypothetical protein